MNKLYYGNKLLDVAYLLAILTIVCSIFEGSFSVAYGYSSGSLTLFGNGLASFIEVISGFGILRMISRIRNGQIDNSEQIERNALHITGTGLYLLTIGLIYTGFVNAYYGKHPDTTISGIIIAVATIIIIGILVIKKMKIGHDLHSKALIADAKATRICVSMSTMVLISGIIYELTKFEYADSLGAISVAYFAYKEARECFRFA